MKASDLQIFGGQYDLYEMYEYYNSVMFNNELVPARLFWVDGMVTAAGVCICSYKAGRPSPPAIIRLSKQLLLHRSEYDVTNVLVHEMIHALLFQRDVHDAVPHGQAWTECATNINMHFGLNVTQYHHTVDPAKLRLLDQESRARIRNSFTGVGRRIDDQLVDRVTSQVVADDLIIVDVEDSAEEPAEPEVVDVDRLFSHADVSSPSDSGSIVSLS